MSRQDYEVLGRRPSHRLDSCVTPSRVDWQLLSLLTPQVPQCRTGGRGGLPQVGTSISCPWPPTLSFLSGHFVDLSLSPTGLTARLGSDLLRLHPRYVCRRTSPFDTDPLETSRLRGGRCRRMVSHWLSTHVCCSSPYRVRLWSDGPSLRPRWETFDLVELVHWISETESQVMACLSKTSKFPYLCIFREPRLRPCICHPPVTIYNDTWFLQDFVRTLG